MIALSTAFLTLGRAELPGVELARRILDLGFRAVELDYRVSREQAKVLGALALSGELRVVSVHHPFPRSPEVAPSDAHRERVRLSSLDPDERRAAVRLAQETLARAADLGAGVVVLHLGAVEVAGVDPRSLAARVRAGEEEGPRLTALRAEIAAARRASAAPHLSAVLGSVDRLASEALRRGVVLGLENRVSPEEIPDRGELENLLRELEGAPLGHWHDTGHAASLERLGFVASQRELLEAFSGRVAGFHLHDAKGLADHLPPGEGEVRFAELAPLAPAAAPLVLEVHPPASPEALRAGLAVLAEAGFPA